jgi:hypothetical protein
MMTVTQFSLQEFFREHRKPKPSASEETNIIEMKVKASRLGILPQSKGDTLL